MSASLIIKEAASALRRTPVASFMSALTIALAIGLGGILAFLAVRANQALTELGAHLEIEAFFDPAVSSEHVAEIAKTVVSQDQLIGSELVVTKDQAIEAYKTATGEDAAAVLGYNPLPASIRVSLRDPSTVNAASVAKFLKGITGVAEVHYDSETLTTLEDRARGLKLLGLLIGGVLLLAALAFLNTTTRLAIQARRDTLRTMLLLGADRSMLRLPFVIEGAVLGLLGGLIGSGLFLLIGKFLLPEISPEVALHRDDLQHALPLLLALIATGPISATLITYLSTQLNINRAKLEGRG